MRSSWAERLAHAHDKSPERDVFGRRPATPLEIQSAIDPQIVFSATNQEDTPNWAILKEEREARKRQARLKKHRR